MKASSAVSIAAEQLEYTLNAYSYVCSGYPLGGPSLLCEQIGLPKDILR